MNNTSAAARTSRLSIKPGHAVSVQVAVGTAIQAVRGKVWLTQEGDVRDYCVPAGVTFFADRPGQMVLAAVDGESTAIVKPDAEGVVPGTVRIDSFERLARDARYAHAIYIGGLVTAAVTMVIAGVRRLRELVSRRAHPVRDVRCTSMR